MVVAAGQGAQCDLAFCFIYIKPTGLSVFVIITVYYTLADPGFKTVFSFLLYYQFP